MNSIIQLHFEVLESAILTALKYCLSKQTHTAICDISKITLIVENKTVFPSTQKTKRSSVFTKAVLIILMSLLAFT